MGKNNKILVVILAVGFFVTGIMVLPALASAKFKVAIVLPGTITDESFCQTGYEGLKRIEKEMGAEIAYTERVAESDQVENIRDYARRGYDLVIAHGGQFDDAALKVSKQFPHVKRGTSTRK